MHERNLGTRQPVLKKATIMVTTVTVRQMKNMSLSCSYGITAERTGTVQMTSATSVYALPVLYD